MTSMPKSMVVGAAGAVVLAALAGLYGGLTRALTAPAGSEETQILPAPTAPIASAKPITASTPIMDEATVRKLAREEAQAILAHPAAKKPDDDDDDSAGAVSVQPAETTPTVPLSPAKPAVPAPSAAPQ